MAEAHNAHTDSTAAAFAAIEASRIGPRQKRALRLLVEGQSYRAAARAAGFHSTSALRRYARRFGLVEAHNRARPAVAAADEEVKSAAVVSEMRHVANLGAKEMRRRIVADPDSISMRDLTVATGVAIDKLAKWEKWGNGEDEDEERRQRQLVQIMERLSSGPHLLVLASPPAPGSMTIAGPYVPPPNTIDVTPIEEREGGG